MVSKVRNFWLCVFSGVVATTLIAVDLGNVKPSNVGLGARHQEIKPFNVGFWGMPSGKQAV